MLTLRHLPDSISSLYHTDLTPLLLFPFATIVVSRLKKLIKTQLYPALFGGIILIMTAEGQVTKSAPIYRVGNDKQLTDKTG